MAILESNIANSNFGNQRIAVWDVTPDAATHTLTTGLSKIAFSTVTIKSGVTDATFGVFVDNVTALGTASVGVIGMSSLVTSGEYTYRVVAYGGS